MFNNKIKLIIFVVCSVFYVLSVATKIYILDYFDYIVRFPKLDKWPPWVIK